MLKRLSKTPVLSSFLALSVGAASAFAQEADDRVPPPPPPPASSAPPFEPMRWGGDPGRPYLSLGVGYVYSRWGKINTNLKNGSFAFRVGGMREFSPSLEGGWNVSLLTGSDNSDNSDNISAITLGLQVKWLLFPGRLTPFAGLGIDFGGYKAWSLQSETSSTITYTKHASGFLFGANPSLGVRLAISPRCSVELAGHYLGYFDSPAYKVGGWGALLGFNLYHP